MEKTPAACAMEWSIDLEKGLRSKKPGKAAEAILQFGPRLEWWNRESTITKAECSMFGLIPGEDKLFTNAIFLRLADAFRLGNKTTKLCVVKLFLSDLRGRSKSRKNNYRRKKNDGFLLSKCKLENRMELLRRAKTVFDSSGDVEERAMALVLFGCWAGFAKDSVEIRYVVLSTLVSASVLEVKASLFAAGCFCALSDDFSSVCLEILINIMTSSETLIAVRLSGARAFSKMGCSASIANRVYKTGLKLVVDSSEEDFTVAMLISLSKIASRSTLLVSRQIELLFSFLTQENTLCLQATSLRCLHFIYARGMHFSASTDSLKTLFGMLDESKHPPALQCQALKILHKILLYDMPTISCMDMLEFSKLSATIENEIQSPILSKKLLAIRVVVDISIKFGGRKGAALDGVSSTLASRVISFVIDRIFLLVKEMLNHHINLDIKQEVKSLLKLLFHLVEEHPYLGGVMLDKICLFIQNLMSMLDRVVGTVKSNLPGDEIIEFEGENEIFITSKLIFLVSRIVLTCVENFKEVGDIASQALNAVQLLVEQVHQCSLFDFYTRTIYLLSLHSRIVSYCKSNETEDNNDFDSNMWISHHDYLVQHEILSVECAKKMLERKDNWSLYKAGKYAACQGAWLTAAFIFEQIMTRVQSDSCYCWLKSLAEFAHSERKVQLLVLPKQGFSMLKWLENYKLSVIHFGDDLGETGKRTSWKVNLHNYIENLLGVFNILRSSVETIGASDMAHAFGFQRWFLALRAKVIECVVDLLKLLGTSPFAQDSTSGNREVKGFMMETPRLWQGVNSLVYPLSQISFQLKRLAHEFDLIAASFIGMDNKSLMVISVLALSCSLLAFSTGFSLFIPNLQAFKSFTVCSSKYFEDRLHAMLIQDLVVRLRHIDCETSNKLSSLFKVSGQPKSCFFPQSRNLLNIGCEARGVLKLCRFAITGMVGLQNEANEVHDDESISRVTDNGLQLLWDIIMKWTHIPFRTPTMFFQLRPYVSTELFASNGERSWDGISLSPGSHLSLNLCLQLKNMHRDLPIQLTKLYCILYCKTTFQIPCPSGENKGQTQVNCQDWGTDNMLDMNEKLLQYVTGCTMTSMSSRENVDDDGVVDTYVSFEPNEKGQGLSTCLLDVSAFPVGSYRIKWHSCCMDNEGSYWSLLPLNAGPVFSVK